jgi:methionyl-tRNA synthetase
MNKKYYITAAIPYVNARPHIGHALEFVQTDTIKRYKNLKSFDAKSLSGGDENALKNVQAAEEKGIPIKKFVDANTETFRKLAIKLNAEFDFWQKGSNKKHHLASQKLWQLCKKDIYKKKYKGLYCVGCEAFYTKEDLNENGECYEHPGKKLEEIEEENYFFRLSKYEDALKKLISSNKLKIIPEKRKKEALSFIESGLEDISISRSNERAKNWGVQVPGDNSQRMYVWFDALNIYQSGVGFDWNEKKYKKYWPADLHVIGKGILRFHAIYWPAFLLSAKLDLPKAIFVHEYFTVEGQKMSKTLGNVVDPLYLIKKYGADPLRYYFLAKFSPFTDGDFSENKLKIVYNADLANGIGNLTARVAKLCETSDFDFKPDQTYKHLDEGVEKHLKDFRFDFALTRIWDLISALDKNLQKTKPWEKRGNELKKILNENVAVIRHIAYNLRPFLPETSGKIEKQFKGSKIKSSRPLFPRIK